MEVAVNAPETGYIYRMDRPHPGAQQAGEATGTGVVQLFAELHDMTPRQLKERYLELFGVEHSSGCKQQLIRRIGWKLQALAHGDLSERAQRRILEICQDPELKIHLPAALVPIRRSVPRPQQLKKSFKTGTCEPGTELRREYRGKTVVVKVLKNGFEFEGQGYGSLSAVARAATGTHWNGLVFFGVKKRNELAQELKCAASRP
jgi:hypothetical protein